MQITVAKSAGFCFGVNRAVEKVYELIESGKKVCTLGPIIHNPHIVSELENKGVRIISEPCEATSEETIVIRSHGVSRKIHDEVEQRQLACYDATCPFVSKIHRLVQTFSQNGYNILIAGDEGHPEVQGIIGYCTTPHYCFQDASELQIICKKNANFSKKPICVVAQTTFDMVKWKKCLEILKNLCTNAKIFDTICSATSDRQSEARILASNSDLILVIGGKHSSNTNKLYAICKEYCEKTYLIESADELPMTAVRAAQHIGITAGASTPASIIKEVFNTMTEEIKTTTHETEENFEQLLEESLKNFNTDERVIGVVTSIAPNEVQVDIESRKQAGFIPADELSNDPTAKPEDLVKVGDTLELLIMRTNDQEGTIMLSKKRLDSIRGWDTIVKAEEEKTVLTGIVTEVIKGGIIVITNGVKVFVPASLATASKGEPLEDLLKKEVSFRIIEVNKSRRRAVGSIRALLKEEHDKKIAEFWDNTEEGKTYTGKVKSLTSYGAFVDIGGIDGMIHISELSWNRIKHPSEVVKVGDTVEVFIKSLDRENGKISLGYKKAEDNPWEILKNEYPVGTVCEVEIVGMTAFGAFARIINGIDGLIHVSQISNERVEKPQDVLSVGQKVTVKITAIDFDKKRISLSMKELLNNTEEVSE